MGHVLYIAHGAVCLLLGLCNYNVPLLRTLRMNSKASYIESSSIILYQVKQHRKPWLFVLFALTYTCCRILWIPVMMKQLVVDNGMEYTNIIFVLLVVFYVLQIHWWIKIIKIIWKGGGSDSEEEEKKKRKKDDDINNDHHDDDDDDDDDKKNKKDE
jgi:hypothetical protein